jgi:hypothetical protein
LRWAASSYFEGDLALLDDGADVLRLLHPGVDVGGQQFGQGARNGQRLGVGIGLADQLVQCQFLDVQIVIGRDFLRDHKVIAGLRFARVGDGGRANLEIALGRRQLLGHRRFLGPHEGQAVLRAQHVEISLADANNQVLFGSQ